MAVARPDAPAKLAALRRLADNEPGAQDISVGDSNHLLRHGLVDVDRLPDGRRRHTITPAGWALLGEHAAPGSVLRSANRPRPGHGIAVGDVVAYADGRTLSGAWRVRHALVTGFDDTDAAGPTVQLETPGLPEVRRPLAAVTRVDPPVAWYHEDLPAANPPAGPPGTGVPTHPRGRRDADAQTGTGTDHHILRRGQRETPTPSSKSPAPAQGCTSRTHAKHRDSSATSDSPCTERRSGRLRTALRPRRCPSPEP